MRVKKTINTLVVESVNNTTTDIGEAVSEINPTGSNELLEEFTSLLVDRIIFKIKQKVMAQVETITDELALEAVILIEDKISKLTSLPEEQQKEKQVEKIRKPKIAVCGFLGDQNQVILSKTQHLCDVVFWNDRTGSGITQLKKLASSCEIIFWHSDHANHSSYTAAKNKGANLRIIRGGTTRMIEAILQTYGNQNAE